TAVTISVLANDTDPNGLALSVTNLSQPASGAAVRNSNGTVTYTPKTGFAGTDTFTYQASDGQSASNVATGTVQVTDSPPVSNNDSATTAQSKPVSISVLANDTDPDGDPLSVVNLTAPANGTTSFSNDVVTYTPKAGFIGTDTFTYQASDGTLS